MKESLETLIGQTLRTYSQKNKITLPENLDYGVVVTKDPSHGDFSSNVAFKLTRLVRKKPTDIARDLAGLITSVKKEKSSESIVDRVEVAGNGFINFFLTKTSLSSILTHIFEEKERYGKSEFGKDIHVMIEFVSANPTGPLTIAHGRQAAVGDSLARILRMTGHTAMSEYYLNDAGRQIRILGQSLLARYRECLGRPLELPEDGYQGEYLKKLAEALREMKQDTLLKETEEKQADFCSKFAALRLLEEIKQDLKAFGVVFDHYTSESTLYQKGEIEKAFEALRAKNYLYEKDGAVWFRSTDFGDDKDRVVKKSSGDLTYLAPDIAYHRSKFERGFHRLIDLLGPDHHGYTVRLKAACQALGHDEKDIEILIVQLVTLYRKGKPVRMSTRAGEFVTLRELMEEVGKDAARFFFIMRRVESHLDFDLDLAKQKSQDNPVYYLQYAHARIAGLLKFSELPVTVVDVQLELLKTLEETGLIKKISEYPDILIRASRALEPYIVADYLREVAASFHKFYSLHRIVSEDEELTKARLLLSEATRIVMQNGLEILGISQPESM